MATILSHRLTIPFALTLSVFLLYSGTFDLGFFSDDFEGITRYQKWGLGGLSNNYDNAFFMPFSFLFQALELQISSHYGFIKVLNLTLFSVTGIFLFLLAQRLFSTHSNGRSAAIITAFIFICSPYQTEAINWFSSQAYVLATLFSVWALWILIREKQSPRTPIYFNLLLLLALLNKEIALCVPLIATAFFFLQNETDRSNLKKSLVGSILVLLLYFVLRRITLGEWIGGYGDAVHANFHPSTLLNGLSAYFAKFFGFYRYLPGGINKIFAVCAFLILGGLLYFSSRKNPHQLRIGIVLFVCFVLSLLPIINLETSFLGDIQSDRYGYFPSVFFSLFLGGCLFYTHVTAKGAFILLWLPLSLLLLYQTNGIWQQAAQQRDNFLHALRAYPLPSEFILLNAPDNWKGVYIFRHGLEEFLGPEQRVHLVATHFLNDDRRFSRTVHWDNEKGEFTAGSTLQKYAEVSGIDISTGPRQSLFHAGVTVTIDESIVRMKKVFYYDPVPGKFYACSTE